MFEIIGVLSGILAVTGVVLNNYRLRACFLVWLVSNVASAVIHAHTQTWALFVRDVVFIGLAVHGFFMWGKKPDKTSKL